jgi:hypothetical protein
VLHVFSPIEVGRQHTYGELKLGETDWSDRMEVLEGGGGSLTLVLKWSMVLLFVPYCSFHISFYYLVYIV